MAEEKAQKPAPFSMNRFLLKVKYSFYSTLIFFVFANPETLKLLQRVVGGLFTLASSDGIPTVLGLFGMGALFFGTMLGLMLLPNE